MHAARRVGGAHGYEARSQREFASRVDQQMENQVSKQPSHHGAKSGV